MIISRFFNCYVYGRLIIMGKAKKEKKRSHEWGRFMYQFFDRTPYMMWHDGVDANVVLELKDEELKEAEDLLIESAREDGMWPTRGLAVLKSKKSISMLKEKLSMNPSSIIKIRVAYALEKIEGTGEHVNLLIEELLSAPFWGDRIEAAMLLKEFPSETVRDALYKGMMDPDYLVRNHSGDSLLGIHGLEPEICEHQEIFKNLCADKKELKNAPELHAKAVELLKEKLKDKKLKKYLP